MKFFHPQSDMEAYSEKIEQYFKENPPVSIGEAVAKIEELTGIKRSYTQVLKFLKDRKFRFFRVGTVPAKALTEKKNEQREFLEQDLVPRLEEAKKGERNVYFVDAAHFVYGTFVSCPWCLTRIFIPTLSGRNRYNVLGAIDAVSHDLYQIYNLYKLNINKIDLDFT
jgi:hypothetical protein